MPADRKQSSLFAGFPTALRAEVETAVDLAKVSRWQIGGVAKIICRPASVSSLSIILSRLQRDRLSHVVLGSTTNLLFSDAGLDEVAVQIGRNLSQVRTSGTVITAQAGTWVPGLARAAMLSGLSGIEHTAGIPGTLGGLVAMNGGSQRRGIGEVVRSITSVGPGGELRVRNRDECGFGYRRSVFQGNGEIIVEVELELASGDAGYIRRNMIEILVQRKRKFPQKWPNCGSVFVSDPAMYQKFGPPGVIIERLGLKGLAIGGAEISPKHANFIVNTGGASALDVLRLVSVIRSRVEAATGFLLQAEGRFVSRSGLITPLHEVDIDAVAAGVA